MNDRPLDAVGFQVTKGELVVGKHDFQKTITAGSDPADQLLGFEAQPSYTGEQTGESIPLTPDLIKQIAMDIGKETVAYIEWMYPQAIEATPKTTFRMAIRNHIYNEIMAAIKVNEEGQIIARLKERDKTRRYIRKLRKVKNVEDYNDVAREFNKKTL
jgi:hypothetical protein